MVNPAQVEIESDGDDTYHKPGTVNVKLVTGNQDSLSENSIAEIDAWARQALAANGFGDY
jgi:hypothetical protein